MLSFDKDGEVEDCDTDDIVATTAVTRTTSSRPWTTTADTVASELVETDGRLLRSRRLLPSGVFRREW